MQQTVSDYIFKRIAMQGVRDVFMVSGGGIMHLCDALGRCPDLTYWCNYNEQATSYAADGYARITGGLGVCLVTTGPGSANALSGVAGAYVDSIPVLVISGQVRTQIGGDYTCQRQVGPQELNAVDMARPVTKYAVTLTEPSEVRYELEKCITTALSDRPGPVWLCVPLDIQNAIVEPEDLNGFPLPIMPRVDKKIIDFLEGKLRKAQRPVIIAGHGIALGGAREDFDQLLLRTHIPTVTPIGAMDLLTEDNPQYQGAFGPIGQRRGNFAVQNADLVLALGASLSLSCMGFDVELAPQAEKILINVDKGELRCKHLNFDHRIHAEVKAIITQLTERFAIEPLPPSKHWIEICANWKKKYGPIPISEAPAEGSVDIYAFYYALSNVTGPEDTFVAGNPMAAASMMHQNLRLRPGQRAFTSVCFGAMGADLPHALGASVARRSSGRTILVTGDGSFLFNVQELMTVGLHKLPVKLFVLNNNGYQSIRTTQNNYFSGRYVGADATSGVANPDFKCLTEAFGLGYMKIESNESLEQKIERILCEAGPTLCEITLSQKQLFYRLGMQKNVDGTLSPRPLQEIEPRVSKEELLKSMILFK